MIRKTIIVVLTLGATLAVVTEIIQVTQSCRPNMGMRAIYIPCPVRIHLGRSEGGRHRFLYAVSEGWYSSIGYVRFGEGEIWEREDEAEVWFHGICVAPVRDSFRRALSVVRMDDVLPSHVFQRAIVFPRGSIVLLLATYPVTVVMREVRRYRRRKRGLCVTCGYDLRGSPERCPECGATPE